MDVILEYPHEYHEFIRLFNEGDYFEAHEVLEDLWVLEVDPLRDFYKGLIQIAVALCHWERGNPSGARKLWITGRGYVAPYQPKFEGLDVQSYLATLDKTFQPLLEGEREICPDLNRSLIPKLELEDEGLISKSAQN